MTKHAGKVYLVGAGPGDPELLTLRGAQCLQIADVILYDYLASPELLNHARPDAETICLGRHGHGRLMAQSQVNSLMVDRAQRGCVVVRLKGGDPMIFARAAEEIAALSAAGIAYEIVPGITAAQAASSYAGIPLTNRDSSSCVTFVAGHERDDKPSELSLDYAALARSPGTLVIYMGITTAAVWSRALLAGGKDGTTPVAILRRCSHPDQKSYFTTLSDVAQLIDSERIRPPAIVVVGAVARDSGLANWFVDRPLFDKTILVTRPERQTKELASKLRRLGANVIQQPAIRIDEPRDWRPVDSAIERLEEFAWVVFSSANGVQYFIRRLWSLGFDLRKLGQARLAAIGPGTVAALLEYHLRVDVQPTEYRAEALAAALAPVTSGKRVLLARASRGREVLPDMLADSGALVEQVIVYESSDIVTPEREIATAMVEGRIDWVTATSSAIARSLVTMFGPSLDKTRLVAISPLTGDVLAELGHHPSAVAENYTMAGLIDALLKAELSQ